MEVENYIVYGCDHGKTPSWRLSRSSWRRRSWAPRTSSSATSTLSSGLRVAVRTLGALAVLIGMALVDPNALEAGRMWLLTRKIRWLQLPKDLHRIVAIDNIMGPRDLQFTTWYLNKTRLRTWDHFPVVVKIDGKELRVKRRKKGWAGWIPKSRSCRRGRRERRRRSRQPGMREQVRDSGRDHEDGDGGGKMQEPYLKGKISGKSQGTQDENLMPG